MSNHTKALAFINRLVEKFGNGGYIFRGTTTRYSLQKGHKGVRDGINSTLYRWVVKDKKKGDLSEEQENLMKVFSENKHFFPDDMEREIVRNVHKMYARNTAKDEILTDLQHFGGKTNMIDFSRNMYVALFFACHGNETGELIALEEKKLKPIDKINYAKRPKKGEIEVIDPVGTQDSRPRVSFQSSVFVRPADGYIAPKKCKKTAVPKKLKKSILEYLRICHNIMENTIYNDLHGFIKNEKNNETYSLYFYLGRANQKENKNAEAIKYYGKCIRINPNSPNTAVAHSNRGDCYCKLENYKRAFKDFDRGIFLKPDFPEVYYNRGTTYSEQKRYKLAIKDYGKAISLNPDFVSAYYNRGNANYNWAKNKRAVKEKCKRAIKDYNKAISLEPDFADAYYNRGLAKEKMGNKKGAEADFAKSKELESKPPKK